MDYCLRSSLPILVLILTCLALTLGVGSTSSTSASISLFGWKGNSTETVIDFAKNDLLLGSRDPIFWFLVPLFSLISIGICALVNYTTLGLTYIFCLPYNYLTARPAWLRIEDIGYTIPTILIEAMTDATSGRSYAAPGFSSGSPRRRIIITCILLLLVSTIIPYQFAYLDACFVQIYTCVRALRLLRTSVSACYFHSQSLNL